MSRPLVVAAGSVLVSVIGVALLFVNGGTLLGDFNMDLLLVGTIYAAVGGVILARAPGNWLGRILLVAGWLWALDLLLNQIAWYGLVTAPGSVPAVGLASWLAAWIWIPGNSLLFSWTPLLFPDGRLPSRRWRAVAGIILAGVIAATVGHALVVWPIRESAVVLDRSFDASTMPGIGGTLASIGDTIGFLLAPFVAVTALVVRYRRSRGMARQQLRWFTAAAAFTAVGIVADQVVSSIWPATAGLASAPALAFLPITLAIAILRYRLYELDRIVSRTVGWTIVTAVLVAVFACGVALLQAVLAPFTQENTLAVAASTLVAFALFQPLRRRVQRAVDRRFDRARYDAQRLGDAFAERLRNDVDLGSLRASLATTADQAVRPASSTVWLNVRGSR
jgi:hypothetical protein